MILLPFPETPKLICYHNKAFPFGIVQANSPEDITEWMCTKCINCVYNPASPLNKFDFAMWDVWGTQEGIMTQQYSNIKNKCLNLSFLILCHCLGRF